jgi:MinD-like ATPase involved in chromosome partitioning or flagellar assembly
MEHRKRPIIGKSCHASARAASGIVAEMAHKFLSTEVRFMGMIQKGDDFSQSILMRTPFLPHRPTASASLGIRQLADLLIEHIITWR